MKNIYLRYILLLPVIFSGCITASIDSNKNPEFGEKVERVYITMRGAPESSEFFYFFQRKLSEAFKSRGIDHQFHVFKELSLETEEDIMNRISQFDPQVLMLISQTERRSTVGNINSSPGATFDIRIMQPNSKIMVWRASLKTDTFSNLGEGAQISTKKLIERMELDGLIHQGSL